MGCNKQCLGEWNEGAHSTIVDRSYDSDCAHRCVIPKELHLDVIASAARAKHLAILDMLRLHEWNELRMVSEASQLLGEDFMCFGFVHTDA